jgi:hypothetical protein
MVMFNLLGHGDITPNQCPRKPAPPQHGFFGNIGIEERHRSLERSLELDSFDRVSIDRASALKGQ